MSERKRIYEWLVEQAMNPAVGINPVKDAASQFLKMGLKAIHQPTERRVAVSKDMTRKAWLKQGGRCRICRKPLALDEAVGDHVDPHNLGGKVTEANIVAVHGAKSEENCNSKKGGRDILSESKRSGNLIKDMLPED